MKNISLILLSFVVVLMSVGRLSAQDVNNPRGIVQVYDVESESDLPENKYDQYYYEDDTIIVSFLFWSSKGKLMLRIENKLTVPIYINWSQSMFLVEGEKIPLTPYLDKLTDEQLKVYEQYKAVEPTLTDMEYEWKRQMNQEESGDKEQIISIEANSTYTKGNYYLIGSQGIVMDTSASYKVYKDRGKRRGNKKAFVFTEEYSKENSPVSFGVSLVYSTDAETKKNVSKIEESFYVTAVHEMEAQHFRGKKVGRTPEGFSVYKFPERSSKRFFVEIDRRNSVSFNKRM